MADLPTPTARLSARVLGVAFIGAGLLHFLRPKPYEAIIPPSLPSPRTLVYISGVAEIVGGVTALFPGTHRFCRWWLIALLVAVFPANVQMAVNPDDIKGLPDIPQWTLWARLPLQAVFIALVVRATRPRD
jgi:uncharacterized membrane protein